MSKSILLAPATPTALPRAWRTINLVHRSHWRPRMIQKFEAWAADYRSDLYALVRRWFELERPLLLRSDLRAVFDQLNADHPHSYVETPLQEMVALLQEAICRP